MRGNEALLLSGLLLALPLGMVLATAGGADAQTMNTFEWSTREHLGDTAAAVTVTLLDAGECKFENGMGGSQNPKGGPMMFEQVVRDDGEVMASLRFSSYRSEQVHAGPVDNRGEIDVAGEATVFPTGTFGSVVSSTGPFPAGTYTFTAGGLDLQSTNEDPTRPGYHALRFTITCEQAFTVDGFQAGHEVLLFSAENMDGGIGVFESLVVSAQLGVSVEKDFQSETVHTWMSWREYQDPGVLMGELVRTTPLGTTMHDLTPTEQVTIRDATGPGLHRLELDRVALDFFSNFGGVIYGLNDVESLDAIVPA